MPVSWPSARARIPVHSGGRTIQVGAFKVEERGGGSDQSGQVFEEGLHWPLEAGRGEVILCPRAPWRNVALLMPWLSPVRPILDFYLKLEVIYSCVSLKIWPKCCSVVTNCSCCPSKGYTLPGVVPAWILGYCCRWAHLGRRLGVGGALQAMNTAFACAQPTLPSVF